MIAGWRRHSDTRFGSEEARQRTFYRLAALRDSVVGAVEELAELVRQLIARWDL